MWALVAVGIASAFGKQNAAVVVPLLLAGLAGARTISLRLALAGCAVVGAGIIVVVLALPHDVRAWVLFVPLNQPYEFWPARIAQCWRFLTFWEPYLAVSFVRGGGRARAPRAALRPARAVRRRRGARCARSGRVHGLLQNARHLRTTSRPRHRDVPYAGALFGTGFLASYQRRPRGRGGRRFLTLFALGVALRGGEKQVPDTQIYAELSAVDALATQLCATKQPIAVTVFPQAFGCPTAMYALVPSLEELQVAFPATMRVERPSTGRSRRAMRSSRPARADRRRASGCRRVEGGAPAHGQEADRSARLGRELLPVEVRVFEHR